MRKFKSIFALILTLAILCTGCASQGVSQPESSEQSKQGESTATDSKESESETDSSSVTATGGTIRVGEYVLDTQMANKSPFANGTFTNMLQVIYEPLLVYNEKKGDLEPGLANSFEWNDAKTELTVELNPDVKWHDGEPFVADDVIYTMQILKDNPEFDRYGLWSKLSSITADGTKVTFKMDKPFVSLPQYLSQILITPKHIWEKEDAKTYVNDMPIGTGPFVYKEYVTGTSITLTANKEYWRGAPKADEMLIIMYNTAPNCTLGLLKGEIDMTFGTMAMSSIPEFKSKENASMDIYAGLGNFSVLMNHENELLADVNVRKAMAMAVNQSDLITKGEYGGVMPTSIAWLPDLFGDKVNESAKNSLTFDLEGAQKVLEDAGYTKGDDGIYQKDGKRLSFTYHNASGAPAQQMEAGMIQQWLLNLGVEIIPKLATWPELTQLAQTGKYDLLQMGINFPPDAYAAINSCFNSSMTAPIGEATSGLNYFRYRSDELDSLLAKAAEETDETKLKDYYYQMQDILAKDYVFLPMYNASGHIPYYDGTNFVGWNDYNASVRSNMNLINLAPVQ